MVMMFEPLRKYATFRGRARRLEYWSFQLLMFILFGALFLWLTSTLGAGWQEMGADEIEARIEAAPSAGLAAVVLAVAALGLFLPSLAVAVRRLHDSDKSGWWLLLNLIPVGGLVILIFNLLDGTRGPNRHGPDPKGRAGPAG